jgi:DNA-directed RNA polymerase specialized sigma24 family protein
VGRVLKKYVARARAHFNTVGAWARSIPSRQPQESHPRTARSTHCSGDTCTTTAGTDVDSPANHASQLALVASIVSEWDHVSRRIFVLRKVYDFDHMEIAARTGISAHSVFEHLASIAKRLAGSPLCGESHASEPSAVHPYPRPS